MQGVEMTSLKDITSQTNFPVMLVIGLITVILTFLALPLGLMSLAGMSYLYFLCRPLLPSKQDATTIFAPAEGIISELKTSDKGTHIYIQQRWDARVSLAMPVSGRIEQNLYIDGAYLPKTDTAFQSMNARRELLIETANGKLITLVQWATPTSRFLLSNVLEGQNLAQGSLCAVNLLGGYVEVILPASYHVVAEVGDYSIAGHTCLAQTAT